VPRNSRDLNHLKSARVKVGQGFPRNNEGSTGDLTLRMTRTGIKLFAKFQGKWYMVGQGNLNRLGSEGINEDQIIGTNNKKISTVDKEGIVKLREKALIDMKPWKIRNTKYDASWGDTGATDKGLVFHNEQEQMKFIMGNNGTVLFEDASSALMPQFTIRNKQNSVNGPWFTLEHDDENPVTAADFGRINFLSKNDAGEDFYYAYISGQAGDIADGAEEGKLLLNAASGSGQVFAALVGDGSGGGYMQVSNDFAVGGKLFLDQVGGDTYLDHSSGDTLDHVVGGDLMMRQMEISTIGNYTQIFGGEISVAVDNASGDELNYVLELTQTLNDTSNTGTPKYKGIKFVLTNTDITGWDEIYMMHLAGAGTTWINNAGSIAIPAAQKIFFDGGTDAANGHTYITQSSDDVLDTYVGGVLKERITEGGVTTLYGDIRVLDEDGSTYSGSSAGALLSNAQISAKRFAVTDNTVTGRLLSVNNWYISNQSFGTSITAADWSSWKFTYACYNATTAVSLKAWSWVGEITVSKDMEYELWDVTIPSNGTAAASTAAKVGSTQSVSVTANAIYTIGQTDLDYTVAAGHQLYVVYRYTDGSGTVYNYGSTTMEFEII
tara:strand:+ start:12582 stop:14402 length:1821 start_codon:yes stop_codon:yes gene_type:complete